MSCDVEAALLQVHECSQFRREVDEQSLPDFQDANGRLKPHHEDCVLRHLEDIHCVSQDDSEGRRASAAESPEQVRVAVGIGRNLAAVRENDIHGGNLVAGEAIESGLHALTSSCEVSA